MALRRNPAAGFEQGQTAPAADTPPATQAHAQPPAPPVAPPPPPPPAPAPVQAAAPVAPPVQAPVAPPVQAPVPAPVAAAAPAQQGAVALRQPSALVVGAARGNPKVLEDMKDRLQVDWNTLYRIKANQGNFMGEENVLFGGWIIAALQSWQDSWQVAPGGDTEEAKQLARYSDDGMHIKGTAELCTTYVARLVQMGYKDASVKKRCVLVCALLDCEKEVANVDVGTLFQIDLPPTSKGKFDQFRVQAQFDMGRGALDESEAPMMKMTAVPTTAKGKTWTMVHFSRPKVAA